MSPVVETINTALHDIRNSYTEIKDDEEHKNDDTLPKNEQKYSMKLSDTPPEPPPRTIYSCTTTTDTPGKIKHFEPKSVSTPVSKTATMEFPPPVVELIKVDKGASEVVVIKTEAKVSPTNSVVRAMMSRNKSGKKKNTLLASMFTLLFIR